MDDRDGGDGKLLDDELAAIREHLQLAKEEAAIPAAKTKNRIARDGSDS